MQKPVKKSHYPGGVDDKEKVSDYLVSVDRDLFNVCQYLINTPSMHRQAATPVLPSDTVAYWLNTANAIFLIVNINGIQKQVSLS